MMGLHAVGTVNVDSQLLDVLLVCLTAERTVTTTMDPDTCYAATSCTKGALPGDDQENCFFFPHRMGTEAFQMDWTKQVDSLDNSHDCL